MLHSCRDLIQEFRIDFIVIFLRFLSTSVSMAFRYCLHVTVSIAVSVSQFSVFFYNVLCI